MQAKAAEVAEKKPRADGQRNRERILEMAKKEFTCSGAKASRGTEMWSMWAPSDRDYYDPLGLDCDEDEPEICEDCGARWDRGEACEDWCQANRPAPEPVPVSCLSVEQQEVTFFEEAWHK